MTRPPTATARPARRGEQGTALTEMAISVPVLLLLLYWSSAVTDVLVLKIKAEEAARFAIWETTVFRAPAAISADVGNRFADLRSPASENRTFTSLLLFPKASDLTWSATVDTTTRRTGIGGGTYQAPSAPSWWQTALNRLGSFLSGVVDDMAESQKFNVYGAATARVTLSATQSGRKIILGGGDLAGSRGTNDLGEPSFLSNFNLQAPLGAQKPMQIIFDTWKAWPKPAAYTLDGAPTNSGVSPAQTYTVVEEQVAAQVDKIAFFGLNRYSWFTAISGALTTLFNNGVSRVAFGGDLPAVNATGRMDGNRSGTSPLDWGPITIRPVEAPAPSETWVPGRGLGTNRLGDKMSSSRTPFVADDTHEMTGALDRSRYTVPYRINSQYWTSRGWWPVVTDGGTNADGTGVYLTPLPAAIATNNQYVQSWACRGHYFGGAVNPQATTLARRYPACASR